MKISLTHAKVNSFQGHKLENRIAQKVFVSNLEVVNIVS